jgi:hypothetical protein
MVLFVVASRGARSLGVVASQQRAPLAFAMGGAQQRMMSSVADKDNILPVSVITHRLFIVVLVLISKNP